MGRPQENYKNTLQAFQTTTPEEATPTALTLMSEIIEDSGFREPVKEELHYLTKILELIGEGNPDRKKIVDNAIDSFHNVNKEISKLNQKYVSDLHDIYSDFLLDFRHEAKQADVETMNEAYEKLKSEFKRHL